MLGGSLGVLGVSWEGSWGPLRSHREVLGVLWGVLGGSLWFPGAVMDMWDFLLTIGEIDATVHEAKS